MEIERKFIIKNIPFKLEEYDFDAIEQGYICTNPVIRIRRKGDKYYITYKSKGLMKREEYEDEISLDQFIHLNKKIDYHLITKKRYYIPLYDNLVAELDVFLDRLKGLVLCEVEFDSEIQANNFNAPQWFGEEVTFNPSFQNNHLCKLNDISLLGIPKI